jgi:hypothetical protein
MLDRLLKISSLSGAVLIFCGVLKLIIYYSAFRIPIVEFLSFSEIITSFLDDINLLLIYVLVMIIQTLPLMNYLHRKSNLDIEALYNALLLYVHGKKYRFIAFFVAFGLILGALLYFQIIDLNYVVIYLLIFCLIQTMTYLTLSRTSDGKAEISDASAVLILAISISASILLLAKHDIIETKQGSVSASIQTSTETINCDQKSGNLYLGKTDDFIFIREQNSHTEAIPVSEIRRLQFR